MRSPAWGRSGGRLSRSARLALPGTFAVVCVTSISVVADANFPISSFLFLLVILLQSFSGDFLSSVVVSIEAVLALDYFFVDPRYTFELANVIDVVALASFLVTALIVTRLICRVRAEAASARSQHERLVHLYRLAQELLAVAPQKTASADFLEAFRGAFGITAVCLFDVETADTYEVGASAKGLTRKTRDAYLSDREGDDRLSGISVRRLHVWNKTNAWIGFEGLEDPELTAGPLSALAATVLARTRALQHASESTAAAQAELYRSAILDALAHEFKTPLATILMAAGGIREAGPLGSAQVELTETVEAEAARLASLTSRLLRLAIVDREEVKPRIETIELVSLMEELVEQHARRSPDLHISFVKESASIAGQADVELLRLAVSQLLENACKYAEPGSAVSLQIQDRHEIVEIRVSNCGSSIPKRDQNRIFDRFYRGSNTAQAQPGSGLGLYVARKIAIAHGGALELESDGLERREVSFRLRIPATAGLKTEEDHVVTAN